MDDQEVHAQHLEFYGRASGFFDDMCIAPGDEHHKALEVISKDVERLDLRTCLDVGCGTGRGVAHLREAFPQRTVVGLDPMLPMLRRCMERRTGSPLVLANGRAMPFRSGSFDAVTAFGILHHDPRPNDIVREMTRVATRAIYLSDSNRFGQGPLPLRLLKFALWRARLWPAANYLKTRGKGYVFSSTDGYIYSYSVYDSLDILRGWAKTIQLVPTGSSSPRSGLPLLLTASHLLVCAYR